MARPQSIVSLDPIDRSRTHNKGLIGRFFITRRYGGKPMHKTADFGHYIFTGKQRSGKTVSAIWYAEYLAKRWKKKGKRVVLYSNLDIGNPVTCATLVPLLEQIKYDQNVVYIVIVDELQGYFPKDTKNTAKLQQIDRLTSSLSQIGKRQVYVLSTAQVYGRINKSLREQCLYMVYCHPATFTKKTVNEFIDGDDIMCDDLGRWSGDPKRIIVHGLPKHDFDTHKMITE